MREGDSIVKKGFETPLIAPNKNKFTEKIIAWVRNIFEKDSVNKLLLKGQTTFKVKCQISGSSL